MISNPQARAANDGIAASPMLRRKRAPQNQQLHSPLVLFSSNPEFPSHSSLLACLSYPQSSFCPIILLHLLFLPV